MSTLRITSNLLSIESFSFSISVKTGNLFAKGIKNWRPWYASPCAAFAPLGNFTLLFSRFTKIYNARAQPLFCKWNVLFIKAMRTRFFYLCSFLELPINLTVLPQKWVLAVKNYLQLCMMKSIQKPIARLLVIWKH